MITAKRIANLINLESIIIKWVIFIFLCITVFGLSFFFLKPSDTKDQTAKNLKFMHCTKCGKEQSYNVVLAGGKCGRCKPGTEPGILIGSEESQVGRTNDPWKKFKSALIIEFVFFLWALIRLITKSRAIKKRIITLIMHCPKCNWKLRFKPKSIGEIGMCPRCKKKFIFPGHGVEYTEEQPA